MPTDKFSAESKLSQFIRFGLVLVFIVFLMNPLYAWMSRMDSQPPKLERAWLASQDSKVHFKYGKHSGKDKLNTNGVFIAVIKESLTASDAEAVASKVSSSNQFIHQSDTYIPIWAATRSGHFPAFEPDARINYGSFSELATDVLPNEILETIRRGDAFLIVALDEVSFSIARIKAE